MKQNSVRAITRGLFALFFVILVPNGLAEEPKIGGILTYNTNQVILHFDTEARREYTLEYADVWCFSQGRFTATMNCSTWKALFTAPVIPFGNHYVLIDYTTNSHRIYRLRATP